MIGTDATIQGASIDGFCMWGPWVFRCLIVIADLLIEFYVGGDNGPLGAVLFAKLPHHYEVIFKNDLRTNGLVTIMAQAGSMVVINVIPVIFHALAIRVV